MKRRASFNVMQAPSVVSLATAVACAWLLLTPHSAGAARLGEVARVSSLGEPLRVEIRSPGISKEAAIDCIRLIQSEGPAGVTVIRSARITVTGANEAARLVVQGNEPSFDPVVHFTLRDQCIARLEKGYTLFLDPPSSTPSPVIRQAPAPRPAAASGPTQTWATAQGESLASIATNLYPNDVNARRRFITTVARANPDLFDGDPGRINAPLPTGTALRVPELRQTATPRPAAPSAAAEPAQTNDTAAAPRSTAGTSAGSTPRLRVEGEQAVVSAPTSPTRGTSDAALLAREASLVEAIDRTIKLQLEMMERMRRLEEVQTALMLQLGSDPRSPAPATDLGAVAAQDLTSPPIPQPPEQAQTPPSPPSQVSTGPASAPKDDIPVREISPVSQTRSGFAWQDWALPVGGLALVAALVLLLRQRRRSSADTESVMPAEPEASMWPADAPSTVGERTAAAHLEAEQPVQTAAYKPALDFNTGMESAEAEAETQPPLKFEDEVAEEHDSAVELADIMISFGRVHGAAETLADFIRSNPKQAVTPWLKLMDVYRMAGMRMEFDALARQLNKTFNVKAVTWDNFDAARQVTQSLEQMPHLIQKLTQCWGSVECQAFLEQLLRDNRGGLREGFPISIIDEILTLAGILEEHLGRFKADPVDPAASPQGSQA